MNHPVTHMIFKLSIPLEIRVDLVQLDFQYVDNG